MAELKRVIFAIDPGKTTGLAILSEYGAFKSMEFDDQLAFLDWMDYNVSTEWHRVEAEVVCESYIVTPETIKKSRQYFSLEIIGTLRWLTHRAAVKFTLQSPSAGKSFGTDEKLKALGWWTPGKGHANDAARHLVTFCAKLGIPEVLEKLHGLDQE